MPRYDSFREDKDLHQREFKRPVENAEERKKRMARVHQAVSAWRIPEVEDPPVDFTVEEAEALAGGAFFDTYATEDVDDFKRRAARKRSYHRRKERQAERKRAREKVLDESMEEMARDSFERSEARRLWELRQIMRRAATRRY